MRRREAGKASLAGIAGDRRPDGQCAALQAVPSAVVERLLRDFEDFGLNGYQARVLVSLLRANSATPTQLAEFAGIHRTSVYPVLRELHGMGLAEQLVGKQGLWGSPGRDEAVNRLHALQEERLAALQVRMQETRATLATHLRDTPPPPAPYVRILVTAVQVSNAYDQALEEATTEVLVLDRGPYVNVSGAPNPMVLEALARGVGARALYREEEVGDASLELWHRELDAYHQAGVEGRIVDDVPMRLAVFDRRRALFGLRQPDDPDHPDQLDVLVDHPAFAAAMVSVFEQLWATGRPYDAADTSLCDAEGASEVRELIGHSARRHPVSATSSPPATGT